MDKLIFKKEYRLWWLTLILLLLRCECQLQIDVRNDNGGDEQGIEDGNDTISGPKDADQLGIPRCDSHYDCVYNGFCIKDSDGYGRCLCPKSCPSIIPATCRNRKLGSACRVMDQAYQARFKLANPSCYQSLCICPPMFDPILVGVNDPPLRLNTTLLPAKCDRRELAVIGLAYPSASVYKGSDATLFCCINVDPQGFVDASAVMFLQNTTFMREATKHPFKEQQTERIACWELEIKNVQLSDSGTYTCLVNSLAYHGQPPVSANYTINFEVKVPRMIKNLKVAANEKSANVTWDVEDGQNDLTINLRLLRRTDLRGQTVFQKQNASSPVLIDNLRPATPYTLFVNGSDSQTQPFELTEHFTTLETKPLPPNEEDVRILNSGTSLICEVEWKSPPITNGRITKYYVRVLGSLRRPRPDGQLVADHYPPASEQGGKCANWDSEERPTDGINPVDFSTEFLSCKYGPLKPNRNYTVTVWAENNAGRSAPKKFSKHCTTPYAEPEQVEEPTTSSANMTSFNLNFPSPPDDTNGPISCYYIAVIPLHANVSIDTLPPPQDIIMENTAKVFHNNLQDPSVDKKRYFAYVAESYLHTLPESTVIGDGSPLEGVEPCNVLYLSRYKAEDSALRTGLKYTGFLIVRVDKGEDEGKQQQQQQQAFLTKIMDKKLQRGVRQLHLSGPAYGYSNYFKPVFLDINDNSSSVSKGLIISSIVFLFLFASTLVSLVFLHRTGHLSSLSSCPFFASLLDKDVTDRAPLKHDYSPIPVDDLPTEYIIRHRDSDFLFTKEYDAIPHYSLPSTASERRENAAKNRYNDIKAFDDTRAKLKKINGDEYSDYINANFVKSWNGKKTFIAAQAPLECTVGDFWRMVWEQEAYLIVMVANLMEKNRVQCAKYWPDDIPARYGEMMVSPLDATYYADYAVRTFEVTNTGSSRFSPSRSEFNGSIDSHPDSEYANVPCIRNGTAETSFGGGQSRQIVQYHFQNWNDYRAPECSTGLLRFIYKLRQLPQFNEYPVIIHCSAGVGRTGTFIAIDSMLDQCQAEKKTDIYGFVAKLRKQRNLMVQSQEQYVFIYKALAEWHLFGITDMDAEQLPDYYKSLTEGGFRDRSSSFSGLARVIRSDKAATTNGLKEEFQRLEKSLEMPPKSSFAVKDENVMKNRFQAAVPFDRNRVVLSPLIGYVELSYINASFIKGYFYPYILAQDPVSEATVYDFWCMISDKQVTTLVMLSNEEDWNDSEKYWPEELHTPQVFERPNHQVVVELLDDEEHSTYRMRRMSYQMKNGNQSGEVVQFAFTAWPSGDVVPPQTEPLLSLIGRVLERQSSLPDSGPIVLHCRNGSTETGVFCCVSLLLERVKAENRVDVFQTVKGLQLQRPQMFTRIEHYQFCYQAVLDYLNSSVRS